VIKVDNKIAHYINAQKYYNGFVSEKQNSNHVEMTFLTISAEGFARWFMMFGDQAEIVSPPMVKDRIAELTEAISKRNGVMV
jgi:predicted DNA-binding transcriptional regulator YafY